MEGVSTVLVLEHFGVEKRILSLVLSRLSTMDTIETLMVTLASYTHTNSHNSDTIRTKRQLAF